MRQLKYMHSPAATKHACQPGTVLPAWQGRVVRVVCLAGCRQLESKLPPAHLPTNTSQPPYRASFKVTILLDDGSNPEATVAGWDDKEISVGEFYTTGGGISDTIGYYLDGATNLYSIRTSVPSTSAAGATPGGYTFRVYAVYSTGAVSETRQATYTIA
jgi:hypothetical protein